MEQSAETISLNTPYAGKLIVMIEDVGEHSLDLGNGHLLMHYISAALILLTRKFNIDQDNTIEIISFDAENHKLVVREK